jgi:hypothetical protein
MKEALSIELLSCLQKEIEARLCQFKPIAGDRSPWRWEWRPADNLTFFLLLQPMEYLDQFTLELAWSESGDFPWAALGKKRVDRARGRLRLPDLWTQGAVEFLWDVDPAKSTATKVYLESLSKETALAPPQDSPDEEVLPRLRALARESIDKLEQYGLPLFQQVAEVRGLKIEVHRAN